MQVITDAKELEKHTYIKTRNPAVFPKKERLGLPPRPMNEWDYADGWVLKGDFSKFFYTPAPFLLLRNGPPGPEVAEGSRADRLR